MAKSTHPNPWHDLDGDELLSTSEFYDQDGTPINVNEVPIDDEDLADLDLLEDVEDEIVGTGNGSLWRDPANQTEDPDDTVS